MLLRLHRHPELRLTAVGDEGVVLHLGQRRYFTVNETGLAVLEALAEPRTRDEVTDLVLESFEADRGEAEEAIREFVDQCLRVKLLEERE